MTHIGMIGIGLMGHGIATNLQKHGHPLTLLEHPGNQPLESLTTGGATTVTTPRAVAESSEIIILCVTGSPQVEAVLTGEQGVLKGLKPGAIVIDCSTAVPTSTVKLAQQVVAAGGRFLDAAMTRTPKEAAAGKPFEAGGAYRGKYDATMMGSLGEVRKTGLDNQVSPLLTGQLLFGVRDDERTHPHSAGRDPAGPAAVAANGRVDRLP